MRAPGQDPGGGPPRWLAGWFGLLLRSFPEPFRRRFGSSMRETFVHRYRSRRARGRRAVARLVIRTTADMVASGLLERRRGATVTRGRQKGSGVMLEQVQRDLVFAFRSLVRNPVFAAAAVLTLALGVGATTSIFSVVNGVLLRPLPWADADRLVMVFRASVDNPTGVGPMSRPDVEDLGQLDALDALVAYTSGSVTLTGMGEAAVVPGTRVTTGILQAFDLDPYLGRDLTVGDTREGAWNVVVVSHAFWQDRLGGDREVLGRTLELGGEPYEIVGVAPPGFDYPDGSRLWRPYRVIPGWCERGCHTFRVIGRLAEGATVEVMRDQAQATAVQLEEEYPESNHEKRFNVMPLEERVVGDVRSELWILLAAVGLVLLVACANVANLLLARAQNRTTEVGVRAAMGASRGRLLAQVLTESVVLAVVGGAMGLALAYGGVELLKVISAGAIPRIEEVAVDGTVLAFALGLVVVVALIFGLSPALKLARTSPASALGRSRRGADAGPGGRRSRSVLLAGELALSLVLLAGAGLLLRTFDRLNRVDLGYETENIVRFNLVLPEQAYPDLERVSGFFTDLEDRISALPGVDAVGTAFGAPLGNMGSTGIVLVEGRPEPAPDEEIGAAIRPVTPGYLGTMRIPVLRGRGIQETDREGTVPVAVVTESFAERVFPDEDPLGKQIRVTVDFGYGSPYWTVVGVVPDVHSYGLTRTPYRAVYVPHAQMGPEYVTVAVRSVPGAGPLLPAIREQVRALDPDVPLRSIETMDQAVAEETAPTRFYLTLLAIFAGLAVTLAAIGLYGVVAYLVSRRRQEIGIRMALGAEAGSVVRMVLSQAARPALLGVVVGLATALAGARVLESFLFQVEPRDPVVFVGVTALLLMVAFLATVLPARKASRIDPVEALRAE